VRAIFPLIPVGSIAGVIVVAASWRFYQFVSFKSPGGVTGGISHLWWAIAMTVFACGAAFLVFSVFLRHDIEDELHITSAPRINHS
jgi:hypothetical protein